MRLNSDNTRLPQKEWGMIQDACNNNATINVELTKKLVTHLGELEMDLALCKKCLREGKQPENLGKEDVTPALTVGPPPKPKTKAQIIGGNNNNPK